MQLVCIKNAISVYPSIQVLARRTMALPKGLVLRVKGGEIIGLAQLSTIHLRRSLELLTRIESCSVID